jgi:hypothetical protein
MPTNDETKIHGLNFGRSLQIVFKSAAIYPIEHPAVRHNLEQSFATLETLLREGRPITFGFAEGRVLLNSLLTLDGSLASLEAEFRKRNIAAISFYTGLTFADFKDILKVVTAPAKTVAESGGIEEYLRTRPVPNSRIIPSAKKNEDSNADRMLNVDGESFLMSGGSAGQSAGGSGMVSLDLLLKAGGIKDIGSTGSQDIAEIVQQVVEESAANPDVQPERVLPALAQLIENVGPERFLAIPGVEPKATAPQELASELWEVFTAQWLASQVKSASSDTELATAQDEASLVLTRAKRATEMAERILLRLAGLFEEQGLPSRLLAPIREELVFSALPPSEQKARLMVLQQLSLRDLRRVLRIIKALIFENRSADTIELVEHCCRTLVRNHDQSELISWIPDLIRATPANLHSGLIQTTLKLLGTALRETAFSFPESHRSISSCLAMLASQASQSDDFETLRQIAIEINEVIGNCPDAHADCCCEVRQTLLSSDAIDKIIDSCVGRPEESDRSRNAIILFREIPAAMERVVERLEGEHDAAKRIRILKLAGQFRHSGIPIAVRRLQDERWFFVRNSCQLLGEMGDPDLVAHLAPLLKHSDERVQQAAFQTLQKSHLPDRIRAYAQAVPVLTPLVLDAALDEIMFSLDTACLAGLGKLIMENPPDRAKFVTKALQIALIIDAAGCAELIAHVLSAPEIPEAARILARGAADMRKK